MVRKKEDWKTITVSKAIYERLEKDRIHFEKTIGDGKWSMNDVLNEWVKILDSQT